MRSAKFLFFTNKFVKNKLPAISFFGIFLILFSANGCTYYKTSSPTFPEIEIRHQIENSRDMLVLHLGGNELRDKPAWQIYQLSLEDNGNIIKGKLKAYSSEGINNGNTYNKSTKPGLENEAHIYLNPNAISSIDTAKEAFQINIEDVTKLDIVDYDSRKTTSSQVGVGFAVLGSVIFVISLIALLTKSSCPYMYVSADDAWHFAGEIYSGAIFKSLERDDYLKIDRATTVNGFYNFQLENHLKEKQFTNLIELIQINHPPDVEIHSDQYGNIFGISNPTPPVSATSINSDNQLNKVIKEDDICYAFDELEENVINQLDLEFNNPDKTTNRAKLYLKLKNSMFADYVFGEFTKYFGSYYENWIAKKGSQSPEENIQWQKDQGVRLEIQIFSDNQWQTLDFINLTGPLGSRKLVVPIDLNGLESENINIRLKSAFMVWEIDYASMDFSNEVPLEIYRTSPVLTLNQDSKDIGKLISKDDSLYLEQFEIGDYSFLKFKAAEKKPQQSQSLVIHSKGYYEHIRNYDGLPDIIKLKEFKKPGGLSSFARNKYLQLNTIIQTTTFASSKPDNE